MRAWISLHACMRARVLHHTHARMHVAQVEMIGLNGGGGFPADVSKMEEGGGRHLAAKEGDGEHGPAVEQAASGLLALQRALGKDR